jgi:hypothetical protein
MSDTTKLKHSEAREEFFVQQLHQLVEYAHGCDDRIAELDDALKEKCIEADTMRQHHKNAEAVIAELRKDRERLDSTALFGGWVDYIYTAPDEDGRYLVLLDDMITGANYENGQFWPDAGDEETITHWAKIFPPNSVMNNRTTNGKDQIG